MNIFHLRRWAIFLLALLFSVTVFARGNVEIDWINVDQLPREARETLILVKRGGPFPYSKDGVVFGNREKILPRQPRGYYHEYTVKTPGARNRGARRLISGGDPATSGEYYYTDDHYASFRRIKE